MYFRHLTVDDGFARNSVLSLLQDRQGFMWFGTWDGLYRYDGNELRQFCNMPIPNRVSIQSISHLIEDGLHRIWMGTPAGVVLWDSVNEQVVPFTAKTTQGDSICTGILAMYRETEGYIWISTENGRLFRYDENTDILENIQKPAAQAQSFINHFYGDRRGNLWAVTTAHGVFRCKAAQSTENGCADNKQAGQLQHLLTGPIARQSQCLYQDSQSNYWFGTRNALYRLRQQTDSLVVEEIAGKTSYTGKDICINALDETDRKIYICTDKGLLVYALDTQNLELLKANYTDTHALNDNQLQNLHIDREGGIWIATFYGGINYCSPTSGNFQLYKELNAQIAGHVISHLAEDDKGNIWMGIEDGGVCYWDRNAGTITNYNTETDNGFQPTGNNVQAVYLDDNILYIGMSGRGMDLVNLRTLQHFHQPTDVPGTKQAINSTYAFHKYRDGNIWVGAQSGLFQFDPQKKEMRAIENITGVKVNHITADSKDNVWVSTLGKGAFRYNPQKNSWTQFCHNENDHTSLPCDQLTTLLAQPGNLYVGTEGFGLWVYDEEKDGFYPLAQKDLGDKYIFRILPDGQSLWVSTNKGLYHYNMSTQNIRLYTSEDGLQSKQFKVNSGIRTKDGLFIFGGVNGFNAFRPADLRTNPIAPTVVFTRLYVSNRPVTPHAEDSPLTQTINHTRKLTLKQAHQQFGIEFASLSFSDTHKNKYEYKLEPFESEWQPANGARMATYTNLPAGDYTFCVRTTNGNGIWSQPKRLAVTIRPYWWLSWPMKATYLLTGIFFLLAVARHYRRKHRKAIETVEIRKEQELYRTKMEFFTCMVHEIRTPLTLIIGPLTALMKRKGNIEEVRPDLQLIERNGQRLLGLVNQLMDFRKVEEKSYTVQTEPTDLCQLLRRTMADFSLNFEQRSVQCTLHLPTETVCAQIDPEAFTKVLTNLFSNAAKFTANRVDVSLYRPADRNEWCVDVQDNGCGIAPEDLPHVFDPFYQARQHTADNPNGTGIGLCLVQKLLTLQGGRITVTSKPAEGTCFSVTVPACTLPEISVSVASVPTGENSVQTPDDCKITAPTVTRKRLLVAEDNDEMRSYICSILQNTYDITACRNGHEALETALTTAFDLVVTDLMMPVMGGMELCRQLRSQLATSHIPVIILTAKDDETSQIEGFQQGADLYVTKPFSADVLIAQIASVIRNRERMSTRFRTEPTLTAAELCHSLPDRQFTEALDRCIEQRLSDSELTVDELASELAMGRTLFYQKVKGISGLTPNDYLRTYRLKKAAILFQQGETRVNEVSYRVGFSSPSYFAKRFSARFGMSPSDYLRTIEENNLP